MESLGININQIIFQLVNFGILLAVLNRFLYKPVLDYIQKQRDRDTEYRKIVSEITEQRKKFESAGEEQKRELKKLYDETLDKARKEASGIVDDAKEAAKSEGMRILNEYNTEAKQAHDNILASARQEIYDSAVQIAQSVVVSSLTEEQKDKLMKLAMEKLENA